MATERRIRAGAGPEMNLVTASQLLTSDPDDFT